MSCDSKLVELLTKGQLAQSGLVQHLSKLIREQIEDKSSLKGLSDVEIFSNYVRRSQFKFKQYLSDGQLRNKLGANKQYNQYLQAAEHLNNKLKQNQPQILSRPDLLKEEQALRMAGIGVGQANTYYLNQAITNIALQNQTKSIRFWGKILGYRDYFVIQGVSSKKYLNQLPEDSEAHGLGVNTYSYWVSTNILKGWTELPMVSSCQVKSSRKMKYIFSGQLEKDICNMAGFEGKEKHLLKCICARISHSCELSPKGLYKLNEENNTVLEFEEEFKVPEVAQMNSLDNWVHLNAHILNQGRCTYYIDPKLNEQQKQAFTAELAEKDPVVERLKGIAEDKPYEALGFTSNWAASLCGESVPVNQIGRQEGQTLIYGVVLLKNLTWPGAATVGFRGGWTNIYVGYGHRLSQPLNIIKQMKELQTEGEQKQQKPQPNPKNAPPPPVVSSEEPQSVPPTE